MAYTIPEPERSAVVILADLILPLEDWVRDPGKYRPPGSSNESDFPWRAAATPDKALNATGLQFVLRLEAWIENDETFVDTFSEDAFAERAAALVIDPLKYSPLPPKEMQELRNRLHLSTPKFDLVKSDNVEFTVSGNSASRRAFYDAAWPALRASITRRRPGTRDEWLQFANDLLLRDDAKITGWALGAHAPATIKSPDFITALTRDYLRHALNGEAMGPVGGRPERWAIAVALELGEFRRRGNAFSPIDAEIAVRDFQRKKSDLERKSKA